MKTKIVNGNRVWANEKYLDEIQKYYGKYNENFWFHIEWIDGLLIQELGFTPFSICEGSEGYVLSKEGIKLKLFWINEMLAVHRESGDHLMIYDIRNLLTILREEWKLMVKENL